MGLIETWGRGTNRMVELCESEGLPTPTFNMSTGGLAVTFFFKEAIGAVSTTASSQSDIYSRRDEILSLLLEPLSTSEIHSKLKDPPSLRTVKADLSILKEQGLVVQRGKGRSTRWEINKR